MSGFGASTRQVSPRSSLEAGTKIIMVAKSEKLSGQQSAITSGYLKPKTNNLQCLDMNEKKKRWKQPNAMHAQCTPTERPLKQMSVSPSLMLPTSLLCSLMVGEILLSSCQ